MTFIEKVREAFAPGRLPVRVVAEKPCSAASRADTVRRVAAERFKQPVTIRTRDLGRAYLIQVELRTKNAALDAAGFASMADYLRDALRGIETHETRNILLYGCRPKNMRAMLRQALPGQRFRTQAIDEDIMSVTRTDAATDQNMPETRPTVPASEAAKRLSCTRQWLHQLLQRGELEHFRLTPRKTFVYVDSIEAYTNANNNNNQ